MVRELMVAAILRPLGAATVARACQCRFITDRLPVRWRSWLIVIGSVVGMLALAALIYAGGRDFLSVWQKGSFYYDDLNLPNWPGAFIVCGEDRGALALAVGTGDLRHPHDLGGW